MSKISRPVASLRNRIRPAAPALFASTLLAGAIMAGAMAPAHAADAPKVVASIKPIHSIAAAIMRGVAEPRLLVDGASSPHTYSLKPSEARALQDADLVIYVAHNLEGFLEKPLESLSANSHQLELADIAGIETRKMREGGVWEPHSHGDEGHGEHHDDGDDDDHDHDHDHADADHDHDHEGSEEHHHEHGGNDPHIWMSPANGAAIARAIGRELDAIDPANAKTYDANLQKLLASIDTLGNDLGHRLAPVKDKPFVVFHDAYQYLEASFGLTAVGSITVSPEQAPGAHRLHEIEDKIRNSGAVCVFAEPQFRPAVVQSVIADTGVRSGTLDPLGADIAAGPEAYAGILEQNVDALASCLSGQ